MSFLQESCETSSKTSTILLVRYRDVYLKCEYQIKVIPDFTQFEPPNIDDGYSENNARFDLAALKLSECLETRRRDTAILNPCPVTYNYHEGFAIGMGWTSRERKTLPTDLQEVKLFK